MTRQRHRVRPARRAYAARPRALTRRGVVAGALGVAGLASLGGGLSRLGGDLAAGAGQDDDCLLPGSKLCEPDEWPSENGLLQRTLVAKLDALRGPGSVAYEGGGVGFSGLIPGPTLRLSPGDRLKLKLENHLGEPTNLHFHGLHVSPISPGDDVFVVVSSPGRFDYEFDLRDDHPSALFWYHPHHHQFAQAQVQRGLAGAIIIAEGPVMTPAGAPMRERLLVLQHLTSPAGTFSVNGQIMPRIDIQQGETQLWRILNASSDTFFNLHIEGLTWQRIAAIDGNLLSLAAQDALADPSVLPIGPAERVEVQITGGANDSYELRSLWTRDHPVIAFTRRDNPVFRAADADGSDPLATLAREEAPSLAGQPGTPAPPIALPTAPVPNLADRVNVNERTITFDIHPELNIPVIDGRLFDHHRIDQTVELGVTEEWTIVNETSDTHGWHPFHLHVNDFVVQRITSGGVASELEPQYYQDTVPLPPRAEPMTGPPPVPGEVVFRSEFLHYTGKFVYHCHFLGHEDDGMMAVVEVVQPIRISGARFDKANEKISAGTTVLWKNEDAATYTLVAADGSFISYPIAQNETFAYTFETPGSIAYHVEGQPTIQGVVDVELVKTVEISDTTFDPPELSVEPNTTVSWTNRSGDARTVTADDGSFTSGPLDWRASYSRRFDTPGAAGYTGDGSPEMTGTIIVGDPVERPRAAVKITDAGLEPATTQIVPGATVTWANLGPTAHRVYAEGVFDSQPLEAGQRFSHIFAASGDVSYCLLGAEDDPGACPVGMEGKVTVM